MRSEASPRDGLTVATKAWEVTGSPLLQSPPRGQSGALGNSRLPPPPPPTLREDFRAGAGTWDSAFPHALGSRSQGYGAAQRLPPLLCGPAGLPVTACCHVQP